VQGRIVLVTGASSGIGRAMAIAFAAAGARVLAVGRDQERLADTVAACGQGTSQGLPCDLSDDAEVRSLADWIGRELGRLDVLIHAAGTIEFGPTASADPGGFDRMVVINLRAPYVLTQGLVPLLRASRGHVVFLNSSAGIRPSPGVAAYGATKHGLRGFADALRSELNPDGIRVTSVYPGRTRTPMQRDILRWEGRSEPDEGLLDPAAIAEIVLAAVRLPRDAEVTDIHIRSASPLGGRQHGRHRPDPGAA
jgi:NAD(P)-dependent dehydrogenase (short-subunit alcohol dehydrogenase family)